MKKDRGWWWPNGERHMLEWLANAKNRIVLNGREAYQGRKQLQVFELLAAGHHRTAIDIGSHVGLWAYNLCGLFERVHCFEPVAEHRECFEANMTQHANWTLHDCALGDVERTVGMFTNPTSSGDSWVKGDGNIPMLTLDSFTIPEVDLIKVDAEGFEEKILRGAEQTLLKHRPLVVVEQKRDMAVKFGLEPQGALGYLQSLGGNVLKEISGDYYVRM